MTDKQFTFTSLLEESVTLFRKGWRVILVLNLAWLLGKFLVTDAAPSLIFSLRQLSLGTALGLVVFYLIRFYLDAALIRVFINLYKDKKFTLLEVVQKTNSIFLPFLLLCVGIIAVIGSGMVFLVFPGLLFALWLVFAKLAMVDLKLSPVESMVASREIVRNNGLRIIIYLFGLGIFIALLSTITNSIFTAISGEGVGVVAQYLAEFVLNPFSLVFSFVFYKNLLSQKEEKLIRQKVKKAPLNLIKYLVIAGVIFITLVIFMVISIMSFFSLFREVNPNSAPEIDYSQQEII